ncbi:MAG TPA: hypothetical protein VKP03_02450 [Patescibacteria group bacterium]|nr:hypothetical protein [Patescibacteria group bacterium]
MFEQLFGSKTRVKLIKVFLDNPESKFYVRELTRLTDSLINSIRRELQNLLDMNIVKVVELKDKKKSKGLNKKRFYYLNKNNLFLSDLNNLFSKAQILLEKKLVDRIKRLGNIKYVSFGGVLTDDEKAGTDVLIVGENLSIDKAKRSMKKFEKELGKDLRYTVMELEEFCLRRDIADHFLRQILQNPKNAVVINKVKDKENH